MCVFLGTLCDVTKVLVLVDEKIPEMGLEGDIYSTFLEAKEID